MKRHVHMLDRPSRPRLHRSSCKECVEREKYIAELELAVNDFWTYMNGAPIINFGPSRLRTLVEEQR